MEKIVKREDGTRYKITVDYSEYGHWNIWVSKCEPRKKIFHKIVDSNSFDYRKLNFDEKSKYVMSEYLKHITEDEIKSVIYDACEELKKLKIKPGVL